MKRWLSGLLILLFSACVLASEADNVRAHAVGSMLVGGWIELTPAGTVKSYTLDQAAALPAAVTQVIGQTVPRWKFDPVLADGQPVAVRSRMSLRVEAVPVDAEHDQVRFVGVAFTGATDKAQVTTDSIHVKRKVTLSYPPDADQLGVGGTVYVLMMINRQGTVEHALAEQVNLTTAMSDSRAAYWRNVLARAAVQGMTRYTFQPPTTGPEADSSSWLVRIPVTYAARDSKPDANGSWSVYIPGPIETAAWVQALPESSKDEMMAGSPDATPPGEPLSLARGLHMTDKVDGG
jgi:hypothetical protein